MTGYAFAGALLILSSLFVMLVAIDGSTVRARALASIPIYWLAFGLVIVGQVVSKIALFVEGETA